MKRIHIVGLALVALVAFSGVVAASAAAAEPDFTVCVKAAKSGKAYTGKYTEKACNTESATSTGKYELEPASELKFTKGKSKTTIITTKSTTGTALTVECKKDKVAGEIEPRTLFAVITLEKCEANKSKSDKCGDVSAEAIEIELIAGPRWLNSAETDPGLTAFLDPNTEALDFTCGSESVQIEANLIGTLENTSKGLNITYNVSGGHQEDRSYWQSGEEVTPKGLHTEGDVETTVQGKEELSLKGVSVR